MALVAAGLTVVAVVAVAFPRRPRPSDGRVPCRRPVVPSARPHLGERAWKRAAIVVVGVGGAAWIVAGPVVAVGAGAGVVGAGRLARSRLAAARRGRVAAAVPDLIDLFLIAASAGQPVAASLLVVAPRAPAPVAAPVALAVERFDRGLPLDHCLADLGEALAPEGASLADALRQAASSGVPLVPLLEGVAASARDHQRRRAQEVARRLPVTMLLPLVACTLPAAVVLAVVPVVVVAIGSLSP